MKVEAARLKNYYHILGLQVGATEDQIRRAFRAKAKQYHPDLNRDENARHHFIEVQQAYEFLMDSAQRRNYEILLDENRISAAEQERRERIYKFYVEHQQRVARRRTAMESVLLDDHNPLSSKFWRGVNWLYNIVFMFLFVLMAVLPMMNYFEQLDEAPEKQRSIIYFIVPTLLGITFLVFGYYFWFIAKTDREN